MSTLQYVVSALSGGAGGAALLVFFGKKWVDALADGALEKRKAGYSRELAELQARYARELEGIRGEIGRAVFVTNVHFETEFDALKRTFEAATTLKQIFMGLRPLFEVGPPEEEERRKVLSAKFSECTVAFNAFISVYENLSPFYPKEIYAKFAECAKAANLEMLQIQTARDTIFTHAWYEQALKNQEKFQAAYYQASELIRARIESLAVAGGPPRVRN